MASLDIVHPTQFMDVNALRFLVQRRIKMLMVKCIANGDKMGAALLIRGCQPCYSLPGDKRAFVFI